MKGLDTVWKSPTGPGLDIWTNLQSGAILAASAAEDPDSAERAANVALGMRNVVARRNAVRVLERLVQEAGNEGRRTALLGLLRCTTADRRALVANEAEAVLERQLRRKSHLETYPQAEDEEHVVGKRIRELIFSWRPGEWGGEWDDDVLITEGGDPVLADLPVEAQIRRGDLGSHSFRAHLEPGDLALLKGPRSEVVQSLSRMAIEGVDERERAKAVSCVCLVEDPAFLPAVETALGDHSELVRDVALRALGQLGSEQVLTEASRRLSSGKPDPAALFALGQLGDARGFRIVWDTYLRKPISDSAALAIPTFGEVWEREIPGIFSLPRLLGHSTLHWILMWTYGDHTAEATLDLLRGARDDGAHWLLMKGLRMSRRSESVEKLSPKIVQACCGRFSSSELSMEERKWAFETAVYLAGRKKAQFLGPTLSRLDPVARQALTMKRKS